MAVEEKIIEFDTTYKTDVNSNNISIFLQNASEYENAINVFINNSVGNLFCNNKQISSAELCFVLKNHLSDIDFEIDDDGNLIVHAEDAENYSIDDNGNLIYTYR